MLKRLITGAWMAAGLVALGVAVPGHSAGGGRLGVQVLSGPTGQALPRNTRWLLVKVFQPPKVVPVRVLVAAATRQTGARIPVPRLAAGPVTVRMYAFATPPPAGKSRTATGEDIALAVGTASGRIRPGGTTVLQLSLQSTVVQVQVSPAMAALRAREQLSFTAIGLNARNQAVPGAAFDWFVEDDAIASLVTTAAPAADASETQSVLGVGGGQTTITAREEFGGVDGDAELTVLFAAIAPNTDGPHLSSPQPPLIEEMALGLTPSVLPSKPKCGKISPPGAVADLVVTGTTVLEPGVHFYRNLTVAPKATLRANGALLLIATGAVDIAGEVFTVNGSDGGDLEIRCAGNLTIREGGSVFTVADQAGDASGDLRLCTRGDLICAASAFGLIFTDDGRVSVGSLIMSAPRGRLRLVSVLGLSLFTGNGPVGGDVFLAGDWLDASGSRELFIGAGRNPGHVTLLGCQALDFTNAGTAFSQNAVVAGGSGRLSLLSGGPLTLSSLEAMAAGEGGSSLGICLEGQDGVFIGPQTRIAVANGDLKVTGFLPATGVVVDLRTVSPPPTLLPGKRQPSASASLIVAGSGDLRLQSQIAGEGATGPASAAPAKRARRGRRRRAVRPRALRRQVRRLSATSFVEAGAVVARARRAR